MEGKDRISELLGLLVKTNSPDEPSALPTTVVNAIMKRFHDVCREAQASHRRTSRLHLRWKLENEITEIVAFINDLKNTRYEELDEAEKSAENIRVSYRFHVHLFREVTIAHNLISVMLGAIFRFPLIEWLSMDIILFHFGSTDMSLNENGILS